MTRATKQIRETCVGCGCFLVQCKCGLCTAQRNHESPIRPFKYRCKDCWDRGSIEKRDETICLTRPL